jgi:hypothetical protein
MTDMYGKGDKDNRTPDFETRREGYDRIFGDKLDVLNPAYWPCNRARYLDPDDYVQNPCTGAWHYKTPIL